MILLIKMIVTVDCSFTGTAGIIFQHIIQVLSLLKLAYL